MIVIKYPWSVSANKKIAVIFKTIENNKNETQQD